MIDQRAEDIVCREAEETDAPAVTELFRAAYGEGYVHPQIYDDREVRRMIFDDATLVLVAEHVPSRRVVGIAGVLFEMGAYSDLVGEFGRLVVDPAWRRRGIGHRLMQERIARVGQRLHMAFVEVRVGTPASPAISQAHGFVPVGALPQKLVFGGKREHAGFLVKYFGEALALRRNHPRMIPEAHFLADVALRGVGVEPDVILDEKAPAYPPGGAYDITELKTPGYASLLRIERGRVHHREVFGPQRLSYGLSRLAASDSTYLVAREEGRVVGAIGFTREELERHVRVFEVINTSEDVIRVLFDGLARLCQADGFMCVEVDVGADATRMQRTLLEIGYLPVAYVPAMAFHEVERLDVLKMYRLFGPLLELPFQAPEPTRSVGLRVIRQFEVAELGPRLRETAAGLTLCEGLTDEQAACVARVFEPRILEAGSRIFSIGDPADEILVILQGDVHVEADGMSLGTVGPGECLGEVAFLHDGRHAAQATASTAVDAGVLTRGALNGLSRRRPDIGSVVYRNIARGLGAKLRRADGLEEDSPLASDPP